MPTYPHMCRMDHQEIGHSDSGDDERCPLCRQMDGNDALNRENGILRARVAELEAENTTLRDYRCEVGMEDPDAMLAHLHDLPPEETEAINCFFKPRA